MDATRIWAELTSVFHDVFEDSTLVIGAKTTARDVSGWDSLMHIQLLVAVEQKFNVRFNTGEVAALQNVGEMVSLIAAKTRE
jgi:acyl carrier protein